MLHKFFEQGYWFEPKKYGYGAGLPTVWQGWVLLGAFIAMVVGVSILASRFPPWGPVAGFAVTILLTLPFLIIIKHRTRGGWRWRSGDKD